MNWEGNTRLDLEAVVKNCEKQRFEIAEERIRARYGHSHAEVRYEEATPPKLLFHVTNQKVVALILVQTKNELKEEILCQTIIVK